MGSRQLPTECDHGLTVDWGDFGPDPDNGSVGAELCPECGAAEARLREAFADAVLDHFTANVLAGSVDNLLAIPSRDLLREIRHSILSVCADNDR